MSNIAFVYDVDFTLVDGYHPSLILEARGIDKTSFWNRVTQAQQAARQEGEDGPLDIIYLAFFMHEVQHGKLKGLTIASMHKLGSGLEQMLYPGLPGFFQEVRQASPQHTISHNIASVGIKPLLEGSVLAEHMDHISGYTFYDTFTPGPGIDQVKSTTSAVEKIDAIVRVSKGSNDTQQGYAFPIKHMVYFGDGQTDKPAFHFVRRYGGTAICVFDPRAPGAYEKAQGLKHDVDIIVPADYRRGSRLWSVVMELLKHTDQEPSQEIREINTRRHQAF